MTTRRLFSLPFFLSFPKGICFPLRSHDERQRVNPALEKFIPHAPATEYARETRSRFPAEMTDQSSTGVVPTREG